MMDICPQSICTACFACANVCPKNAISFSENEYGALYPKINQSQCIDCHACEKVCPNNTERSFFVPLECYAAWRTDCEKRRRSASGGLANLFYEYTLSKLNGSVWGVKMTPDFEAVFAEITSLTELEQTQGSKYVHSHIYNEFRNIKKRLDENKFVLFVGLPCQVAGLLNFLRKDYKNLLTCDLICHGVCPGSYLQDEILYLRQQKKIAEVVACSFRENADNNYCLVLYDSQGSSCYRKRAYFNPYFNSFLQAISLRQNCYSCKYARPERVSDITLGDYIGLGKDAPFSEETSNSSIVIINTNQGIGFWASLSKAKNDLKYFSRNYEKAVSFQPSLIKPFAPHAYTEMFLKNYKEMRFAKAARKVLASEIRCRYVKQFFSYLIHFYRAPKKVFKCLKK